MQAETSDPSRQKYEVVMRTAANGWYHEKVLQAPYSDEPEDQKAIYKGLLFYEKI